MSSPVVVVTEPEYRKGEAIFAAVTDLTLVVVPSGEDELAAGIRRSGARHAIVGHLPYRGELYAALRPGAVLARFGVGHDGIDKTKAKAAGLICTNTPGVLDQSVAELTMVLITGAARHLPALASDMQRGTWAARRGAELSGQTLAIIGYGRIGGAVARIASHGYGMRVVGCRRSGGHPIGGSPPDEYATVVTDFAVAVKDADYVSLHMPASPENARFINATRLAQLKPDAWLINTARGAVVDEVALYEALAERRLAGAALDVFEREPYEPADAAHDLRTLPNVILTPHVGSNTTTANHGMAARALQNVRLGEAGRIEEMDRV